MQIHKCLVRLATDPSAHCTSPIFAPTPFCREHYEEYRTLEAREQAASHDVERLGAITEDMVKESVDTYTKVKDVRRDRAVVQLYLESLDARTDARAVLRERFFADVEEDEVGVDQEREEKRSQTAMFIAALDEREKEVVTEEEARAHRKERDVETQVSDTEQEPAIMSQDSFSTAEGPEVVDGPREDAARRMQENFLETPLPHPLLKVVHPPCVCEKEIQSAGSSTSGGTRRCAARGQDQQPCRKNAAKGKTLCVLHYIGHGSSVTTLQFWMRTLERSRAELAPIEVGKGDTKDNIRVTNNYLRILEDTIREYTKHQSIFACQAENIYQERLAGLNQRKTSAALLHGELRGRKDASTAGRTGRAGQWVEGYLVELQREANEEMRELTGDVLLGAASTGLTILLGATLGEGLVLGAAAIWGWRAGRDQLLKK